MFCGAVGPAQGLRECRPSAPTVASSVAPRWTVLWLAALGCGASTERVVPSASRTDVVGSLLEPMPRGASACVATAPYEVSEPEQRVLAEVGTADALGWRSGPSVIATAMCRYGGPRAGAVWRLLVDGEVDLGALPLRVREADAPCEADACDWPVARRDGPVLEIRSPGLTLDGGAGAERTLAALWSRIPHALEVSVGVDGARALSRAGGRVRERVESERERRATLLDWDELVVRAEDRRMRRERVLEAGDDRRLVACDEADFLDAEGIVEQLELRFERLERRRERSALEAELGACALMTLERRSEDRRAVSLALDALERIGQVGEALAWLDRMAVERDHDPEEARRAAAEAWALAARAADPSAGARLARAALVDAADPPARVEALRAALAGALERGRAVGRAASPVEVEETVWRWRRLVSAGSASPLASPVRLPSLGVVPTLLCLVSDAPFEADTEIEVAATFDVASVVEGAIVAQPGFRLAVLPALGVHAVGTGTVALEAMAEPFRSPGAGAFVVVVRARRGGGTVAELRLEGRVERGAVLVERVSPEAAAWDWNGLAEGVFAPFAAVLERRFPDPELRWRLDDHAALEALAADVEALGQARCSVDEGGVRCRVRPGRGLDAVLTAARSLGLLPTPSR
jgi:hypothetical protein